MAATVRRLQSKPDKLRAEQAALLRQALLPLEGEMPGAVRELVAYIDRQTAARNGWTFIMMSPGQNAAVITWLLANSCRPMKAVSLWSKLFTAVDRDTGEVMLTRDQLAEMADTSPGHVSRIMGELEGIEAIVRRRSQVPGMRGSGRIRYFVNSVVATHLAGREREIAQAKAPPGPLLRLMQSGT